MGIAESHRTKTVHAMAVLSALGLALGVLRHYYDIYKHRTVRGISWAFVGLDAAGDLTSLLAIGEHRSRKTSRPSLIKAWTTFSFDSRHLGHCHLRLGTSLVDRNDGFGRGLQPQTIYH